MVRLFFKMTYESRPKLVKGSTQMKFPIISLLREPLFLFLVVGALLFGLYNLVSNQTQESGEVLRIQVTAADIDQLRAGWERQMGRPPWPEELQGLTDNFIREEVLVREALALGLDRDDTVVRRRHRPTESGLGTPNGPTSPTGATSTTH